MITNTNTRRAAALLILAVFFAACGKAGEKSGDSPTVSQNVTEMTPEGAAQPDDGQQTASPSMYSGQYTLAANPAPMVCSMGTYGPVSFSASSVTVTHEGEALTIQSSANSATLAGELTGTVNGDGTFTATSSGTTVYPAVLTAPVDYTVTVTGQFSGSGFTCSVSQALSYPTLGGATCAVSTTASGAKR